MPTLSTAVLEMDRGRPLQHTRVTVEPLPPPGPGQLVLAVERFGMSSNNLTYALLGDLLGHWAPFPAADGWGRVPAWGVATVVAGDPALAPVGARFTGYLPMATHVLVRAVAAHPGLLEISAGRAAMLPMYRELRRIDTDPTWRADLVDAEVVMLPVSPAAGLLDDDLLRAGTRHVVVSSASSKTALGVGRLLVGRGVRVTGLSARARARTVASVGAFDQVLPYDDLAALPVEQDTTYLDVAGDPAIARALAERLGPALTRSIAVGGSRLAALGGLPAPDATMPGPPVVRFSVGERAVELTGRLGRAAVDQVERDARRILVPWADTTFRVHHVDGLQAAGDAWRRLGSGSPGALEALTVIP